MPAFKTHRRFRRGFTIIEVLVIIVIAALLAAVAIPRYGNALNNFSADAAARRIAADLALAQSMARNTGFPQTVTFQASSKQYQILGYTDPDRPGTTYTVTLSAEPYRAQLSSVSLTKAGSNVTQITFDRYGFPDASGFVEVAVGAVTKRVTLDATSGRTSIQ
jgi:type II secretion system protein H